MNETAFDERYTAYQLNRSKLRRFVRGIYLANVQKHCAGRVIDFGCGVGELLSRLPAGSIGLEVNPASVEYCRRQGLDVRLYDPAADEYRLSGLPAGVFESLVISHVLEHLEDPGGVLHSLMAACERLGVRRIIVVVPGEKGFASDATHRIFVNIELLTGYAGLAPDWRIVHTRYFPFNSRRAGKLFTHNELLAVFDHG